MRGLDALARRLERPERLLVGLDFDGTLAPYARTPGRVRIPPRIKALLRALARRADTRVCVISGRRLDDVRRRAGVPGLFYGGNHGFELLEPGGRWAHPSASRARRELLALGLRRAPRLFPGTFFEDKRQTLSLHYRNVPRGLRLGLEKFVRARFAGSSGLRLHAGNQVWELRPDVDWDKGRALRRLAARLGGRWRILFAGDDLTDEEGFRSLGRGAFTVRVGPGRTTARYRISRARVPRLLGLLAARPARRPRPRRRAPALPGLSAGSGRGR